MIPITELYAVLADNPEGGPPGGEEGIVASVIPMLGSTPLVKSRNPETLIPLAQEIANASGKTLHLVRFTVREEVQDIRPVGSC